MVCTMWLPTLQGHFESPRRVKALIGHFRTGDARGMLGPLASALLFLLLSSCSAVIPFRESASDIKEATRSQSSTYLYVANDAIPRVGGHPNRHLFA